LEFELKGKRDLEVALEESINELKVKKIDKKDKISKQKKSIE